MIRRPPRSTLSSSSAASDVYKRQVLALATVAWQLKRSRQDQSKHQSATRRNTRMVASSTSELARFRSLKWKLYQTPAQTLIPHRFTSMDGHSTDCLIRPGLTFTPYADPVPCTAHCCFCSEDMKLQEAPTSNYDKSTQRGAKHEGYHEYFGALEAVLQQLRPLKLGLSLSGLEATADAAWMRSFLGLVRKHEHLWDEKTLYTNGSGFTDPALLECFKQASFDRVELARAHHSEAVNQKIMRFKRGVDIRHNYVYEEVVPQLRGAVSELKNSCVLTQTGVSTLAHMEEYVLWASELGVQTVVFRELSRFGDEYEDNFTSQWSTDNRVQIEPLLAQIAPTLEAARPGWEYACSTVGYYYYNEHFGYGGVEVILEVSSYDAWWGRFAEHRNVVDKLVFHFDGKLCKGWYSDKQDSVLARYREGAAPSPAAGCSDASLSW
eukprot:TRINITY_DN4081_c0_g1_i1.p1 TRINITY_DN4081_c0_g1~~TRINITY_DN4081_c0_g1_i1.p1  ORF type:complete len:437 (+),score=119.53 TRINITY_DN4081_c0_g1_i1:80-1390(+)